MMEQATCNFCGQHEDHPKAHIWPASLGEKGVPYKLCDISGVERVSRSWAGIYDPNLWCVRCEKKSSDLDEYVVPYLQMLEQHITPHLFDDGNPLVLPNGDVGAWTIKSLDPVKFHFFVLSVLWRSSASQRHEVKGFRLGPYEDKIRDILKNEDRHGLANYPFTLLIDRQRSLPGSFIPPRCAEHDETNFVVFYGAGLRFDVKVSNKPMPRALANIANGPTRPLLLMPFTLLRTTDGMNIALNAQKTAPGSLARFSALSKLC